MQEMVFENKSNGYMVRLKDRPGAWAWGKTQEEATQKLIQKYPRLFGIESSKEPSRKEIPPHNCHYTDQSKPFCVICGHLIGGF